MSTRLLTDEAFLKDCREDFYRGSGPGGQKRNKTSSGVRLVHVPTGTIATATDDRSQRINRIHAIRRLRLKLAADVREPVDLEHFEPPGWFVSIRHGTKIEASYKNPLYAPTGGLLLDLLASFNGNPANVAINLGVSTTAVIKFLEGEPVFWASAAHIRAANGLSPLTHARMR